MLRKHFLERKHFLSQENCSYSESIFLNYNTFLKKRRAHFFSWLIFLVLEKLSYIFLIQKHVSQIKKIFLSNSRICSVYTVLQKYAHIGLNPNFFRSTTVDIITRLLDNAAFVCVHVMGRFSKDFSEVRGLRSRGFQLWVEWMTTVLCAEL